MRQILHSMATRKGLNFSSSSSASANWVPRSHSADSPAASKESNLRGDREKVGMCPLRFILVFISATLAGYIAWRSVQSKEPSLFELPGDEGDDEKAASEKAKGLQFREMMTKGFWVFVDMASGRYLWRNLGAKNSS